MSLLQSFHQVVVLTAFAKMSLSANVTQQMAINDTLNKTLHRSPDASDGRIRTHDHDVVKSLLAWYTFIHRFSDFV
jgi:hypothetical protein